MGLPRKKTPPRNALQPLRKAGSVPEGKVRKEPGRKALCGNGQTELLAENLFEKVLLFSQGPSLKDKTVSALHS